MPLSSRPRIAWVSERHLRVQVADESTPESWARVRAAVQQLRAAMLSGFIDATPAYTTVLLEFVLGGLDAHEIEATVARVLNEENPDSRLDGKLVEIPVCYEGECAPDIDDVARLHGVSPGKVAAMHAAGEYVACFVGFMPGFAYLGGLPATLSTPRLDRPRVRVPAGSVGIAGDQTGVYPFASPGGWRLIGRTPVRMFDPSRARPALVEIGDRVRFALVDRLEFLAMEARERARPSADSANSPSPSLLIHDPGMQTTVQDLGRPGHAMHGVTKGGAADAWSLRIGNRLVGNVDGAAGLEMTLKGCDVEFREGAVIALCGGEVEVEFESGPRVPMWAPIEVRKGQRLRIGRVTRGARVYLSVGGGIDVPRVMGSMSTHLVAGFGGYEGRALCAGDGLVIGKPRAGVKRLSETDRERACRPVFADELTIVPGAQHGDFADVERAALASEFIVSAQSDRTGVRLEGRVLASSQGGRMVSEGMACGSVQVPADSRPIILGVDHPTTGGYPVIGCIAAASLPALGQLRPGSRVRLRWVDVNEARALAAKERAWLDRTLPENAP